MHDAAASWMMTTLDNSPFMIALVQTATMLPMFLLSLPSGAIADRVDRRRLLIATQTWMTLCAAVLGVLTWELGHEMRPWILLLLTLLMGIGNAMTAPAWQAIVPELVQKSDVPSAVALGGISFNLSRIAGPALGGIAAAKLGPGAVFLLNAVSFLCVVGVLISWRREKQPAPPESLWRSIRSGIDYARQEPGMRTIIIRASGTVFFGSASFSLFAAMAKSEFSVDGTGYGTLLGCLGVGAVLGGIFVPRLRERFSNNTLIGVGVAGVVLQIIGMAAIRSLPLIALIMLGGGLAWTLVMLTFNITILHLAPVHLRSRALSIFLLTFTGAITLGSAFWGIVATNFGLVNALLYAASGLFVAMIVLSRFRIADN